MKFIQGKDRDQTEFFCLNQAVSEDNEVRLIDLKSTENLAQKLLAAACTKFMEGVLFSARILTRYFM